MDPAESRLRKLIDAFVRAARINLKRLSIHIVRHVTSRACVCVCGE